MSSTLYQMTQQPRLRWCAGRPSQGNLWLIGDRRMGCSISLSRRLALVCLNKKSGKLGCTVVSPCSGSHRLDYRFRLRCLLNGIADHVAPLSPRAVIVANGGIAE